MLKIHSWTKWAWSPLNELQNGYLRKGWLPNSGFLRTDSYFSVLHSFHEWEPRSCSRSICLETSMQLQPCFLVFHHCLLFALFPHCPPQASHQTAAACSSPPCLSCPCCWLWSSGRISLNKICLCCAQVSVQACFRRGASDWNKIKSNNCRLACLLRYQNMQLDESMSLTLGRARLPKYIAKTLI